jgi:hypothetical protein
MGPIFSRSSCDELFQIFIYILVYSKRLEMVYTHRELEILMQILGKSSRRGTGYLH